MAQASPPAPTLRPGERLLRGEVIITNLDALGLHIAQEALADVTDLTALTDVELERLRYQAIRVSNADRSRIDPRVLAEMARRGMDSTGRRAPAAQFNEAA